MDAQERIRFNKMERSVTQIETDVTAIKIALLGTPLSGEKGLAGRVDVLNAKLELVESELRILREEKARNAIYVKVINFILATLTVGISTLLFSLLKNK